MIAVVLNIFQHMSKTGNAVSHSGPVSLIIYFVFFVFFRLKGNTVLYCKMHQALTTHTVLVNGLH